MQLEHSLKKLCYFSELNDTIRENLPQTQPANFKLPASDLPERTKNFIGRENYLKVMEDTFYSSVNKNIIVLRSFPGTGKTTLAKEFGYKFKRKSFNDHFTYWVKSDGSNANDYFQKFAQYNLGIHLDRKSKNNQDLLIKQIKNKLIGTTCNVLFIFDNFAACV